jgi:hypothetical protein
MAFFTQNNATLGKNVIIALSFQKNAHIFAENCQKHRKLSKTPKIVKNTENGQKSPKIVTSTPVSFQSASRRSPCGSAQLAVSSAAAATSKVTASSISTKSRRPTRFAWTPKNFPFSGEHYKMLGLVYTTIDFREISGRFGEVF